MFALTLVSLATFLLGVLVGAILYRGWQAGAFSSGTPAVQIIADFKGCTRKDHMFAHEGWIGEILGIISSSGMRPVANVGYNYENNSYTIAVIVEESHVVLHMWPDEGVVNADVFFCNFGADNRVNAREVVRILKEFYGATSVKKTAIRRLP